MASKYKAVKGAHLNDAQAETYGRRLDALEKRNGFLTPSLVLEDAKLESSPLHNYFDWDNKAAAENWRLGQASYLLRSIVITIDGEKEQELRGFYSVTPDEHMNTTATSVYVSLNTILTDVEKREEVVAYALQELRGWADRYRQYSELTSLIKIIDGFKR